MRKPCCCDRGACCHLDETCEVTTQEKCEEACGIFHPDLPCLECGDDSDCMGGSCIGGECDNGVDCAYKRGPCCFCESDFSDCTEDLTEPECVLGESSRTCVDGEIVIEYEWEIGVWQGPDHTCEDSCDCQDETGACCCDGDCSPDVSYQECIDDNCYYLGNDSNCGGSNPGGNGNPDSPNCGWGGWCYPEGCTKESREAFCNSNPECCPATRYYSDRCCFDYGCYDLECYGLGGPSDSTLEQFCNGSAIECTQQGGGMYCPVGTMMTDRCTSNYDYCNCGDLSQCPCFKCGIWDPESRTCSPQESDCVDSASCGGCCEEKGACCYPPDEDGHFVCIVVGRTQCNESNTQGYEPRGAVFHAGQWCEEVCWGAEPECPQFGACCINGEECIQNLREEECNKLEGVFQGTGSTQCENCGDVGYCCVPNGTSSDISLAEFGFCLGNVTQGNVIVSGCPHDYDSGAVVCFPADRCCKTGVVSGSGGCNDGESGSYIGITENQCIQIGGEWNGTGPDPDGNHEVGYHECRDSGCGDDPFECVCSYAYCADPEQGQDCGYTDITSDCVVVELPSCTGSEYCRYYACLSFCRDLCVESGGDFNQDCHNSEYGWVGIATGICDQGSQFGEPLTCDDVGADIPIDACFLGECENWCCCSFIDDCQNEGQETCLPIDCNQSDVCNAFGGVFIHSECPDDLCPCPGGNDQDDDEPLP